MNGRVSLALFDCARFHGVRIIRRVLAERGAVIIAILQREPTPEMR
jgi:hypothetical protein